MGKANSHFSLGFTNQTFSSGIHICQIFNTDEERMQTIYHFLASAIASNERGACFSERVSPDQLISYFSGLGLSWQSLLEQGNFRLSGTSEVYFQGQRFDPDRMLELLKEYYQAAVRDGYASARVIGEMSPEVQHLPGGERLREYESRVSLLQRQFPVTTICQYDSQLFDGAVIMDIMKVHPYLLVNGNVIQNPGYITPEDYLGSR